MTRARELANFADDTAGLETLTVSDITDLSVSASNINSATNQIVDSSTDLNVDSNTLVVDKSANAVGIGTASPDANSSLHINSTGYHPLVVNTTSAGGGGMILQHSGTYKGHVGTAGSTHLSNSSTDDILIRAANNLLLASGGNNERIRISSDGKVGIGSTSPSSQLSIGETSGTPTFTIGRTGTNPIITAGGANTDLKLSAVGSGGGLHLDTNGSTRLTINASGNVGIGKSPSTPLHIYKTGLPDASTTALLTIDGKFASNTIDSSDGAGIAFRLENALGGSQTTTCISSSYSASFNHLLLQAGGGNVGIGTTNPESRLEIYGNNNTSASITIRNTNPNPDSHWQITPLYDSDVLAFRSANNSYANRMTIAGNGDVTMPSGKLSINTSSADATILTGKNSGSANANIYLGATGTGNAEIVLDGSNGDFAGSDYYILRQLNDLNIENWLGTSGDYIWKTNGGTERVRLYNDGRFKHISGNTQLVKEQYAYSTSSFPSDGNWHTMQSGLNAHHVFLVRAYAAGGGFHTSALFIVANTYASGGVYSFSSGSGWSSNIELRWTGSTYSYNLEGRNTGSNTANTFWRSKQINI